MLTELKTKKAKDVMLVEVVQISIDENDSSVEDPTASTSILNSELPLPTLPRSMTGYVLALFAPKAPNAPPPLATRKRNVTFLQIRPMESMMNSAQLLRKFQPVGTTLLTCLMGHSNLLARSEQIL
ncbi:hypothetical protein Tco_1391733 [Tanacetum coccineum]